MKLHDYLQAKGKLSDFYADMTQYDLQKAQHEADKRRCPQAEQMLALQERNLAQEGRAIREKYFTPYSQSEVLSHRAEPDPKEWYSICNQTARQCDAEGV